MESSRVKFAEAALNPDWAAFDRGADLLKKLYVRGDLTSAQLEEALERLVTARHPADIGAVIEALPIGISFTPAERRLGEPLVLQSVKSPVTITGRWQVGAQTEIIALMRPIVVDFTQAELDATEVELRVSAYVRRSRAILIIPEYLQVVVTESKGQVVFEFERSQLLPGLPLLKLSANARLGEIVLRRPAEPNSQRRRGRIRRRRSVTG